MSENNSRPDLESIRAKLDGARGRDYWRSLDEIAASDGFQDFLHREFPRQASEWLDDEGRRNFLKLMGASLALAGMSACTRQPTEVIMPYVNAPESFVPGKPLFYATAFTLSGLATGVLMESHMGRPTKVEGNPQHPASLGATDVMTQASVLNLYDPDRSQTVNFLGEIRSYGSFLPIFRKALKVPEPPPEPEVPLTPEQRAAQKPAPPQLRDGKGLRILTETVTSPTLTAQLQEILALYPGAKWYQYEPLGANSARVGSKLAFGQYVNTVYHFDAADVVLSLDADFLGVGSGGIRYARDFASKRRVRGDQTAMNRFYAVETTPTNSGAKADHRIPIKPSQMADFTRALAAAVGAGGAGGQAPVDSKWFNALVKDLQAHRGASIVIPGENQTPEVHALAHAINGALGDAGKTVTYTDPVEANPVDHLESLRALVGDLDSGVVEVLVIIGGNPVFNAPPDLDLRDKLLKAKLRVRLGLYEDETSELCQWHINEAHALEAWSDARAYDGTITIMQPLIAPLYQGRSAHDLLTAFTDTPEKSSYDLIREYWQKQHPGADFEDWWKRSVHDGFVAGSALQAKSFAAKVPPAQSGAGGAGGALEISFHPDPYIYDGRFANNGWLQELPRPISRLTWDNAALVSPATAQRLGLNNEDRVELKVQGRSVWAAVWVHPGQPNDSIAVNLGFGRTRAGRAGNGAGFDAYQLRPSSSLTFATGLELRKLGKRFRLAATQHHYLIDGGELESREAKKRGVVRSAPISEYKAKPDFAQEIIEDPAKQGLTIYPETFKYEGYKWGMVIDQTACVGCNACVTACQAENNIAVVGKEQVLNTREMHWIRVDRYYQGSPDNPQMHFQPVPCMQCEYAPCELVCPVAATAHDQDGINTMVYNRCVGTRYCSNNCPYKVRRFNFLLFSDWVTESTKLQKNPDVTVRSRGVMEKCTYCIQRINGAKITAEKEDRRVHDGEIVTACEQACPAQAIIFGDMNDPNSRIAKLKQEKLNYSLLADLNTRPRTTYLASLRNPNPEIET